MDFLFKPVVALVFAVWMFFVAMWVSVTAAGALGLKDAGILLVLVPVMGGMIWAAGVIEDVAHAISDRVKAARVAARAALEQAGATPQAPAEGVIDVDLGGGSEPHPAPAYAGAVPNSEAACGASVTST